MTKQTLLKKDIIESFNRAADTYDQAAFFQREIADRLLERLDYIKIDPNIILDLGAGTGYTSLSLEHRYKKAKIIAFDLSDKMLQKSKQNKRWFDRKRYICGDVETLPFVDNSVDMIFSNLMLHWTNNLEKAISEMYRVLKPEGLLLFSTLGPDTLYELRQSWSESDEESHVHQFIDMHHLGDVLLKTRFKDPVMDMEFVTVTYNDLKKVLNDLKDLGTQNIAQNRMKGLTGKKRFTKFVNAYEAYRNEEGYIPVTYEVIYGIAWGQATQSQEYSIPLHSIKKRNKDD